MICNYQVTNEMMMLQGKQIKLQVEIVVEMFKLFYTIAVIGGKEGYNVSIAEYFIGE
jgi:hypothetical protein